VLAADGQYNLAMLELNAAKVLGADIREMALALGQRLSDARGSLVSRMKSARFEYRRPSPSMDSDFDSMRARRDVDALPHAL
jgi:hypothetical protein